MESAFNYRKNNNRSRSRREVNAKNPLAALDERLCSTDRTVERGTLTRTRPSAQPRVGTRTCEQDEELKVWTATKVSRAHFS